MLFKELDADLSALTNFHYTPRHINEELTVIANVPSIKMEEGDIIERKSVKQSVRGKLTLVSR